MAALTVGAAARIQQQEVDEEEKGAVAVVGVLQIENEQEVAEAEAPQAPVLLQAPEVVLVLLLCLQCLMRRARLVLCATHGRWAPKWRC